MTVLPPADAPTRAIQAAFLASLARIARKTDPYRYWLLENVLPAEAAAAIVDLPIARPDGLVFSGRRETNNARRRYFDEPARREFPVVRACAEAFQSPEIVAAIEREIGADLAGTNLRIEYCQDADGFWLEPHADIPVKRFTMSLYLCRGEEAIDMGTDIYDRGKNWVGRAPSDFNSAMIFIPSPEAIHGFAPRPIKGVRKSLIVNYVMPEWRNRHELAFPETPVRGAA
jgi:hypothetical protein